MAQGSLPFLRHLVEDSSKRGLSDYLSFLDTSSGGEQRPGTPHIDRVLEQRRERRSGEGSPKDDQSPAYESRLKVLEQQLAELLKRSEESCKGGPKANHDTRASTTTSIESGGAVCERSHPSHTQPHSTHISARSKATPLRKHKSSLKGAPSARSKRSPSKQSRKPTSECFSSDPEMNPSGVTSLQETSHLSTQTTTTSSESARYIQPVMKDLQTRERLAQGPQLAEGAMKCSTNDLQILTRELDAERERRWKAEQATQKLLDHTRELQTRELDASKRHEVLLGKAAELEKKHSDTVKDRSSLAAENEALKKALSELKRMAASSREVEEKQREALHVLQATVKKMESEHGTQYAHQNEEAREREGRIAAAEKEAELLRKTVRHVKGQVSQLQELLACREQDHRRELEGRVSLQSHEFREAVQFEVEKEKERAREAIHQHKERLAQQVQEYKRLEDEFRSALRIESGRYKELLTAYEQIKGEVDASRETAVTAVEKEQRAAQLVANLTAMVKEQKGKIAELVRSKQVSIGQLKVRIAELEVEVGTRNKLESKLESIQEENAKLHSQLLAQTSIAEGLREERKLWGKELAHQGASLAQDRGRMESQVDALSREVKELKDKLKNEEECRKIKEVVAQDQMKTIQHLKEEAQSLEHSTQAELAQLQQECELHRSQLEEMATENQDLQDEVAALLGRKEELKDALANTEREKDAAREKYKQLKANWDSRVQAIASLEAEMDRVRCSFEEREKAVEGEKSAAEEHARSLEERLRACDDGFRKQLEAKERAFQQLLDCTTQEKDREIVAMQDKVKKTEGEMRELLSQLARDKHNMQTKVVQLSRVLSDMQLSHGDSTLHSQS